MPKTHLKYPDDLVSLWNYMHTPDSNGVIPEQEAERIWNELKCLLSGALFKLELPGIGMRKIEIEEAASDYIIYLFQGACPGHIRRSSLLVGDMKKYLAQTRNPVQYEMNNILHEALLRLENEGLIRRNIQGTNINSNTKFVLSEIKSPTTAKFADYEARRDSIPVFKSKPRGGSLEHARMITPTDADDLILKLLTAFGGWTSTDELFRAMRNHIPEQLIITSLTVVNDDGEENSYEPIAAEADDYMFDLDGRQILALSSGVAERIWERVQKISDETFCVYWLPKTTGSPQKIPMRKLGATSTIDGRAKRIDTIFRDEVQMWLPESPYQTSGREKTAAKRGLEKILELLKQRCSEKGYSMSL